MWTVPSTANQAKCFKFCIRRFDAVLGSPNAKKLQAIQHDKCSNVSFTLTRRVATRNYCDSCFESLPGDNPTTVGSGQIAPKKWSNTSRWNDVGQCLNRYVDRWRLASSARIFHISKNAHTVLRLALARTVVGLLVYLRRERHLESATHRTVFRFRHYRS
jgi:hypothetical protein